MKKIIVLYKEDIKHYLQKFGGEFDIKDPNIFDFPIFNFYL